MDSTDHTIMLYTAQTETVVNVLLRDGICFSQRRYVEQKYRESAPVFIATYSWFAAEAEKYLPKPPGAEYPYWVFPELSSVERYGDAHLLSLRVPVGEAIYFDMYDWNKILALRYLGESPQDEQRFRQLLADYGIKRESDIILTQFYPDLKRQVQESWQRLFRHHAEIKSGNTQGVNCVQVALWCLKKEWLSD